MAEMAIMLVALVPLAAGIALIGQYVHLRQRAQAAAREAAWAATADPALIDESLPQKEHMQTVILARQFGSADAAIQSDVQAPETLGDPMLTTFADKPLLKPEGVTLSVYSQAASPSYLDKGLNIIGKATKHLGNLPPNTKGLVTAEVHVQPEQIVGRDGTPLSFLGSLATEKLDFSARTVVLADSWDAAGGGESLDGKGVDTGNRRTVRNVIRPLVPTALIGDKFDKALSTIVNVLGKIPIVNRIFTPGFDQFRFGKTAPDVMPHDKLVEYKDAK
ncbi:TadE/TadG family type IV pilus assembly protein [Oleiagrimonas citrea]|nr:TadE/TadG family type IV pilus assembly protein [Oleiagrimonas citrea]